jgi:hypothetical protein
MYTYGTVTFLFLGRDIMSYRFCSHAILCYTDQGISITALQWSSPVLPNRLVLSLHHYLSQATEQEHDNLARVFVILIAPHPPRLLASPLRGNDNLLTTGIADCGAYISTSSKN